MQASLPRMVQMVSVNDIGQGSESLRILGVRWLPTGAAARGVSEDGSLKKSSDVEEPNGSSKANGAVENGGEGQDKKELGEDGSQQQVPEAMEAEEGDFVNVEVAFAYRTSNQWVRGFFATVTGVMHLKRPL